MMSFRQKGSKNEEGFTLIELSIALAVLGILVAIAVPTYLNVRNKAYDSEAKQTLGEIRSLAWSHYLELDEVPTLDQLGEYGTDRWDYTLVAAVTPDLLQICAEGQVGEPTEGRGWLLTLTEQGAADLTGPDADCTP